MKPQRILVFAAVLFALLLALGLTTRSARADTVILVNAFWAFEDDGLCDSVCMLPEAIRAAQETPGGATVKFDPGVFPAGVEYYYPYSMSIHSTVTLDGAVTGGRVAIDNYYQQIIFRVDSGGTLQLKNLKLENGVDVGPRGSGAISITGGTVNVDNVMFFNNFGGDGGAVHNDHGSFTASNSAFWFNSAVADGGAIYNNEGTVSITNTWFVSSTALRGGAIYNQSGVLNLANSILASNAVAIEGIIYNTGTATLIHNTIALNRKAETPTSDGPGGGIVNTGSGTVLLKNTLLSQNGSLNCLGSGLSDGGYNLDDDLSCGLSAANHSLSGVDPQFVRSQIDLSDPNGLLPLQAGSPAVDAANDNVCAAVPVSNRDQRGTARPKGLHCDIGALEANRATLAVVNRVINNNNGVSSASDFTMNTTGSYLSATSFPGAEAPGTMVGIAPGSYSVTQSGPAGYDTSSSNCSGTIQDGQTLTCTFTNDDVAPPSDYSFSGFFPPVDNLPTVNVAKAGSVIPIKFSLGGDQGFNIFADGYPISSPIDCDRSAPRDPVEETVSAGAGLSYDALTDTYTYIWKTKKGWAGTCTQLTVRLSDGTDHVANFKFK